MAALIDLIADVSAAHEAWSNAIVRTRHSPDYRRDSDNRAAANRALLAAVTLLGAAAKDMGGTHGFRLAGIRATSTMGLGGAVRNWLDAARRRLEAGERRNA